MDKDDDTIIISGSNDITLDVSNYGAADVTYNIDSIDLNGISTITLPQTSYIGPGATVGGLYSTGSASSYTFSTDYNWATTESNVNISNVGVEIKGEGDIKIGDRSMKEFMDKVEDQLAILRPAPELEEKWDQLKELRRQYEECKQDILEKEKLMKILKEK